MWNDFCVVDSMKKFIASDSDEDLTIGADVLSDASDYSDSPKTRQKAKSKQTNRYVLKPAATARDVNSKFIPLILHICTQNTPHSHDNNIIICGPSVDGWIIKKWWFTVNFVYIT